MKKIITLLLVFASSMAVMADEELQVTPFQTVSGITENDWDEEFTFTVQMNNTNTYTALQFDIFLPEGMTLIDEEPMELLRDRFPGTTKKGVFYPSHNYECTDKGNGHYLITLYHEDFEPIKGNSGDLMIFYYLTSEDMKPGIYPIRISGTVLAIDSHHDIKPATSVSYVKIGNPGNEIVDLGDYYVPSFVKEKLAESMNIIAGGECQNLVLDDASDFVVENSFTAVNASYTATVSSSLDYKTLVLPYDCDVPDGFEAYEVGSLAGNTLNMVQVQTITAGKPVILKNAGTAAMAAMNVTINATNGATLDNGMLEGTYTEMLAPVGSYVLQNIGGNVAFYPVAEGKQPKVGAFRAYLTAGASQAKALNLNFDGTVTGIDAVEADTEVMTYNINGQRISNNSKGLRIVRSANGVSKRVM